MSFDIKSFAASTRVSDGAWGTQLQLQGLEAGAAPELWNTENPVAVQAVAESYVQAGSDVVLTNTFGSNRFVLARHGAEDRATELTEAGVALSKKAAGDAAKVFASMGPTGKIVMMEEVPNEEIVAAYEQIARAAQAGGADAVVLETFNELAEIELAVQGVQKGSELPIVCSMTFDSGPEKTSTTMGTAPADLVRMATGASVAAVGANCGIGPENYIRIAELFREATDLPIWIKANAGLPQLGPGGKTFFPMGPEEFAEYVPAIAIAGANFIGGCCGTTPDHIRMVRAAIDKM